MELGIYTSHIVWRIRHRKLRKEAKMTGKSIDDLLSLQENNAQPTRDLESGVLEDSAQTLRQESTEHRPRSTLEVKQEKTSEK
jgi:response regulator of citrate/malate metabolism